MAVHYNKMLPNHRLDKIKSWTVTVVEDLNNLVHIGTSIATCMLKCCFAVCDEKALRDICGVLNEWTIHLCLLREAHHELELWNLEMANGPLPTPLHSKIENTLLPSMKFRKCLFHGSD